MTTGLRSCAKTAENSLNGAGARGAEGARNALRSVSAHVLGALINNAKLDPSEHYFYSSDYVSPDVVPRLDSGSHPL